MAGFKPIWPIFLLYEVHNTTENVNYILPYNVNVLCIYYTKQLMFIRFFVFFYEIETSINFTM